MVGLARTGSNLVRRLLPAEHDSVVFDVDSSQVKKLEAESAIGTGSRDKPRAVWVMVPAGQVAEQTVRELGEPIDPGDVTIDGGNTVTTSCAPSPSSRRESTTSTSTQAAASGISITAIA